MDIPPDARGSQASRGIFTFCRKSPLLDTLGHKTTEIAFYGKTVPSLLLFWNGQGALVLTQIRCYKAKVVQGMEEKHPVEEQ